MCVSDEADSPERFSLLLFLDKWNHISPCFSPDCRFLSLLSSGGFFFVCFFLPDKILRFALKEPFYRVNVVLRPSCSFVENQFIINVKVNVFCWSKRSRNGGFTLTFIFYYLKLFFWEGKKTQKLCASFWLKCSGLNGKITKLCLIFRCKSWMTHFFFGAFWLQRDEICLQVKGQTRKQTHIFASLMSLRVCQTPVSGIFMIFQMMSFDRKSHIKIQNKSFFFGYNIYIYTHKPPSSLFHRLCCS